MALRVVPYRVENESLTEEELDLVITPVLGWW